MVKSMFCIYISLKEVTGVTGVTYIEKDCVCFAIAPNSVMDSLAPVTPGYPAGYPFEVTKR